MGTRNKTYEDATFVEKRPEHNRKDGDHYIAKEPFKPRENTMAYSNTSATTNSVENNSNMTHSKKALQWIALGLIGIAFTGVAISFSVAITGALVGVFVFSLLKGKFALIKWVQKKTP